MSKRLNLLVSLNAYEDPIPTNNPTRNAFKWVRDYQGVSIEEPQSSCVKLSAGESLSLFSGVVALFNTPASYSLALKSGTSSTYVITANIESVYRQNRTLGSDATTEVTVTKNGSVTTFESTNGTDFDLITGLVQVGDEVRIGSGFNSANRGKFKILSRTATSFSVENALSVAEIVVLGADFASDVKIYGSTGVQIGQKLEITGGFSPVSHGTYEITDVNSNYVEINSTAVLPDESGISNSPSIISYYSSNKTFLYIESDKKLDIKLNGSVVTNKLEPFNIGTKKVSGIFMTNTFVYSATVENKSLETATIFFATGE